MKIENGEMKIIGILSYFDESPSWLGTVVAGLGQFCDTIVALDGAYALYPGARPRSLPDQAEAIVHTAEAVDLECIMYQPRDVFWGNEIEKRNLSLKLAGAVAESERDWVVVFDADMHLMKVNPEAVRWDLANTTLDVATMTTLQGKDMLDGDMADLAQIVDIEHEWTGRSRLVYRYSTSLQYGPAHWAVSREKGRGKRRKRVWLWGYEKVEPALDLNANLVTYHRSTERTVLRRQSAKAYYDTRDEMKIEAPYSP